MTLEEVQIVHIDQGINTEKTQMKIIDIVNMTETGEIDPQGENMIIEGEMIAILRTEDLRKEVPPKELL